MSSNRSWVRWRRASLVVSVLALVALLAAGAAQAVPAPPTATTDPATNVTQTSATLNGKVDPNEDATTWFFQWRKVGDATWTNTTGGTVNGTDPVAVSETITGLQPNTRYEYRVVADNTLSLTPVEGNIVTFTTLAQPTISIGDRVVVEGHTGSQDVSVAVTLSAPSSQTVTVSYFGSPDPGAPATPDQDYVANVSGTLTFAPGETTKPIVVTVMGDAIDEVEERLLINLQSPQNASIADGQAVLTIDDDDGPSISIDDVAKLEGTAAPVSTPFEFEVRLSAPSPQAITVQYTTVPDTAAQGNDYLPASGTLVIPPGASARTITVHVTPDTAPESPERFVVQLAAPTEATIVDGVAVGTIVNDDTFAPPPPPPPPPPPAVAVPVLA